MPEPWYILEKWIQLHLLILGGEPDCSNLKFSIAMRELKPLGWIDEIEEKKPGKGRPNKIYSFKVGFKDIIDHIGKQQKTAFDEAKASIKRLRELGKD